MLAYHDAKDVYRADVKDFFLHEDRGNADRCMARCLCYAQAGMRQTVKP